MQMIVRFRIPVVEACAFFDHFLNQPHVAQQSQIAVDGRQPDARIILLHPAQDLFRTHMMAFALDGFQDCLSLMCLTSIHTVSLLRSIIIITHCN